MTNNKKPTKKEMFAKILSHVTDEKEKEFLLHEIELLENKGKKKDGELTETQKANKALGEAILEALDDGSSMTISAMIKNIPACNGLSTSKVSAVVRGLKEIGVVIREEIKGVAFFKKA